MKTIRHWKSLVRLCIAALTCFLAVNCWAQETKGPSLVRILSLTGDTALRPLLLANDELFVLHGRSNTSEPDAITLESTISEFERRDTPNGQLIILGAKAATNPKFAAKMFNNKGYCITADYSSVPPSIKLTKEPEKYSYWKVPQDEGPIVNVTDFKHPAYLSLDSEMTTFAHGPLTLGMRLVTLSPDPMYRFEVKKIEQPIAK
jgi:hypothetical protein